MIYNLRTNNNQTYFPILGNTKIYYDKKNIKISIKHYTLYQKEKLLYSFIFYTIISQKKQVSILIHNNSKKIFLSLKNDLKFYFFHLQREYGVLEDDVLLLITQIDCGMAKVDDPRRVRQVENFFCNHIRRVKNGLFKRGGEKKKKI